MPSNVAVSHERVLAAVTSDEPWTASEVAEVVGCARRTAHKKLCELVDAGSLRTKKVGARGRVWWRPDPDEREARERRRDAAVVETVSDGVYVVDSAGRFAFVNDAFARMAGYEPDELIGAHGSPAVNEAEVRNASAPVAELPADEREGSIEVELVRRDGTTVPAEETFSRVETRDGRVRIGVVRDVSDRVERERELRDQRDQLERYRRVTTLVYEAIRDVMRATSREAIDAVVCNALTSGEAYARAEIGEIDESGGIERRAAAGWAPTEATASPTAPGAAISRTDDGFARATVALSYDGRSMGHLVLASDRDAAFGGSERALLDELGAVVGLAVSAVERKQALINDSAIRLEFESPTLGERFAADGADRAEITVDRTVQIDDETVVQYLSVSGMDASAFLGVLGGLETALDAVVVADDGPAARVAVWVTPESMAERLARVGGRVRQLRLDGEHLLVRVDVPPGSVREVTESLLAEHPDLSLRSQRTVVTSSETPANFDTSVIAGLSERQQVALELAYFGGYYERPRVSTGTDLAEAMEISPPTFHNHLREAERRTLARLFDD